MYLPDHTSPARSRWRHRLATAAHLGLLLLLCSGAPLQAQTGESTSLWDESRFQLFGFFSQAYAITDGNQILGIDEDGTHDYRTAALQLRYRMSEKDSVSIQLAHEELGESPIADANDELELDWIFYHRRLGDRTQLKVGKVPIPRGLYNEILDVGTALPFYRPPIVAYGESAFVSETVDGVVLSRDLFGASGWNLQADLYYGGWRILEVASIDRGTDFAEVKADDGMGFQLWLRPPVPGLRVGVSGQQFLASEGLLRPPGVKERWRSWQGSVEWVGPRVSVRGEYLEADSEVVGYTGYYGQVGIRLTSRLSLNLQAEWADLEIVVPGFAMEWPLVRDRAVGLAYSFSSGVVAKVEVHDNEGYSTEVPPPDFFGPPAETAYGILSLSVSF